MRPSLPDPQGAVLEQVLLGTPYLSCGVPDKVDVGPVERLERGAFASSIERWRLSSKRLPVHWDHRAGAESVIGDVDPARMRETAEGLVVAGRLDLSESGIAREAWRSLKAGRIGLSFGYLPLKAHKDGDVRVLTEVDLFEVSLTPAPVNDGTRILSFKSAQDGITPRQRKEMERMLDLTRPIWQELAEPAGAKSVRRSAPLERASFEA